MRGPIKSEKGRRAWAGYQIRSRTKHEKRMAPSVGGVSRSKSHHARKMNAAERGRGIKFEVASSIKSDCRRASAGYQMRNRTKSVRITERMGIRYSTKPKCVTHSFSRTARDIRPWCNAQPGMLRGQGVSLTNASLRQPAPGIGHITSLRGQGAS